MNTLRLLSLGLAITAALLLVSGSLGFTSTTADRGVSVDVTDDEDAFVGYDTGDESGAQSGTTLTLVDVTNRFDQNVAVSDIEITLESEDSVEFGEVDTPETIAPGESKPVTAELTQCTPDEQTDVAATVTVEGESVEATLFGDSDSETIERSFEIRCASPEEQASISFTAGNGNGPAKITGVPTGTAVEATVLYENKSGHVLQERGEFVAGHPLKTQVDGTAKGRNTILCAKIGGQTHEKQGREEACTL